MSRTHCYQLIALHFFLSYCFNAKGMLTVNLSPTDVQVNVGEWANFSCSMSCELALTHTMNWFIGVSPNNGRRVDAGFEHRTGFLIELTEVSGCTEFNNLSEAQKIEELHIFASSVEKLSKTPVQCGAMRKMPTLPDLFSHYSIMTIEDDRDETAKKQTHVNEHKALVEEEERLPFPSETEQVTATATKTVTVTVTQSAQATNSPVISKSNGNLKGVSSSLVIIFLVSLPFFEY